MSNLSKSITAGLLIVLAGGILSFSAQAEGVSSHDAGHDMVKDSCKGMKGNMPAFSDFDLDGDGTIVETEFNEGHAKKMSEMAAEGHEMKHAGDAPGFSGIDTNEDGGISEQEFTAHKAEHHKDMQHGEHKQDK